MKFSSLTNEEKTSSGGMTHRLDFSFQDIPAGVAAVTANTVWPITLPLFATGDIVRRILCHLTTPFKDVSDVAFIDTKLSVGDTLSATRWISAIQVNELGTEIIDTFPGAVENFIYTASARLVVTLTTATALKTISDLDVGKGYVLFAIDRPADQARVKGAPFGAGTLTTN